MSTEREMNLREWVAKLPHEHLANKELRELDGFILSYQRKIEELEKFKGQVIYQLAEKNKRIEKLKGLMLLTDPAVSMEGMNSITSRQWNEYVTTFPDER